MSPLEAVNGLLPEEQEEQPMIPINVINLDRDAQRLKLFTQRLTQKGGVPPQAIRRFSAVDGSALTDAEWERLAFPLAKLFCTPGMIGAYLSHIQLWYQIATSDQYDYQIVMEDDASLVCEDYLGKAQAMVDELQAHVGTQNWDVLLLGAFCCVHPDQKYGKYWIKSMAGGGGRTPRRISPHVHIPHRPMGAHAYLLSRRGAQRLIEKASCANFYIDIISWSSHVGLDLYLCHPLLAFCDYNLDSTVGGTTTSLSWGKRLFPKMPWDEYTKVDFQWVMCSPFFKIPYTNNTVVTFGWYLSVWFVWLGLLGPLLSLYLQWISIANVVAPAIVGCGGAVGFIRYMARPRSNPELVARMNQELMLVAKDGNENGAPTATTPSLSKDDKKQQ